MTLKAYIGKRRASSPEPKAKIYHREEGLLQFVVQKHEATHLHYDFRLEVDGVLKSWAIPKGPTLDPAAKRLAMMVEDHPFDYRTFEGVITEGYGAGIVMVWDYGSYSVGDSSPEESEKLVREGIESGHFHVNLNGEKLKGEFILVKLHRRQENEWLWMKKEDAYSTKEDVLKLDRSALSGKNLEEIAAEHHFQPKRSPRRSKPEVEAPSPMPHAIRPMLATLTEKPFDDPNWIFEIKLDGFRALAEINDSQVSFYSRNLLSFTNKFPRIVETLKKLKINAIFDGEIVGLDTTGVSHFQMLQNIEESSPNTYYYVFDILYYNGKDLMQTPLIERKSVLRSLLGRTSPVRYLDFVEENGREFFDLCKSKELEGVIAKKKSSLYHPGTRSKEWLKIKIQMRQEAIICGFTEPKKSRKNFGALIIGVYEENELRYVAHVGGGFSTKQLKEIREMLEKDISDKSPFKNPPKTHTPVTWVTPKYICEVEFKEWTNEGIMRQPIFLGLRADKPLSSITKEKKVPVPTQQIALPKTPLFSFKDYSFITNPEKIFWEKENITKGDVLNYYAQISKYILPYLKDRPEILKRFPNGISKPSFYQKNLEDHPEWIKTIPIQHQAKIVEYLIISDLQSLLFAANLGCIEFHTWFSRYPTLENPDFLIFDLDPEDISFDKVIETALAIHEKLDHLKIPNFCKTSGATGLHIGVPLGALYTYEQARNFALIIAHLVHRALPDITSLERLPKHRQKKVYIDCFQNNFGQSIVMPLSLRAKPGAPVSMPVKWEELKKGIRPIDFTISNAMEYIKSHGDPFEGVLKKAKAINLKRILSNPVDLLGNEV